MSIISGVKAYVNSCPALVVFDTKDRHIDWTDADVDNYGIMQDGEKQIKRFISGGGKYQYNFTLYVKKLSRGDVIRLQNAELLEAVQNWCNDNSRNGILPTMPTGCTATKITAENAMLIEASLGRSTYQIQFTLYYTKS